MADKRISQLVDRGTVANNDVVPIVVSGATTTNKATISSIQTFMQGNLDLGVTSVGITLGSSGTDVSVSGSPITSSGNITINLPTASATNRGLLSSADWSTFNNKQAAGNYVTTDTTQSITGVKTFDTGSLILAAAGTANSTHLRNSAGDSTSVGGSNVFGFNSGNNIYVSTQSKGGFILAFNNSVSNRQYDLPNASGTIALVGGTGVGTVTSVAALTLGTSGTDLSSTVANGTTTPVITLNVPDASATARGVVTTGTQTIAGAKTLTSPLNGTTSIFSSAFASNQTSKIGIGFESDYGLINAWGADASTYAGLKFQISESDGNTYDALRINPDGTLYAPAGGYISILQAASLRVGAANAQSQALTPPVAKFINSANNFVKIALGQGETAPNFNDYYGIIALDNNINLDDNKLRFYLGYDDAVIATHSNDQLVIQGNGNVGIGTATPSAKLHVMGTATLTDALNGTSASFSGNAQADFFTVGTTAATSGGIRLGTQVAIRARNVANTANIPLIESTASDGVSVSNGALILASTGAATFSSTVAGYGASITNIQDESQGLLVRATDNDTSLYLLNLQSSNTTTGQTWVDRFAVTKGGNVGIGTASPNFFGYGSGVTVLSLAATASDRYSAIELVGNRGIGENQNGNIDFVNNNGTATVTSRITALNGASSVLDGILTFHTRTSAGALTERMRITSGGELFWKVTDITGAALTDGGVTFRDSTSNKFIQVSSGVSTDALLLAFYKKNGSGVSNTGTIETSGNSTLYNTTSDYRLKENVKNVEDALLKLNQLKPCTFNYISDSEKIVMGFLAHEVQEVMPQAVTGKKDNVKIEKVEVCPAELDEEGNIITDAVIEEQEVPVYQGIDHSKLVPLLVAAMQEQQYQIQELKTEIDSLKNQIK